MRRSVLFSAAVVLFFGFFRGQAQASIRLSAVGGLNASRFSGFISNADTSTDLGGAGGATIEFKSDSVGLELGVFIDSMHASFEKETSNGRLGALKEITDHDGHSIQIPLLVRCWIHDNLSLGVGPYYRKYIGDLRESRVVEEKNYILSKTTYLNHKSSGSYAQFNRRGGEAGGTISLLAGASIAGIAYVFLDARGNIGITDNTLDRGLNDSSRSMVVQALMGIGFRL